MFFKKHLIFSCICWNLKKLGLDFTFEELLDVLLPLFHVSTQDYIYTRTILTHRTIFLHFFIDSQSNCDFKNYNFCFIKIFWIFFQWTNRNLGEMDYVYSDATIFFWNSSNTQTYLASQKLINFHSSFIIRLYGIGLMKQLNGIRNENYQMKWKKQPYETCELSRLVINFTTKLCSRNWQIILPEILAPIYMYALYEYVT